jgi:hypothetical protein
MQDCEQKYALGQRGRVANLALRITIKSVNPHGRSKAAAARHHRGAEAGRRNTFLPRRREPATFAA